MGCSGHAQGCHTEASAGVGRAEEDFASEDTDEDLEAGTHLYVKTVLVVLPFL